LTTVTNNVPAGLTIGNGSRRTCGQRLSRDLHDCIGLKATNSPIQLRDSESDTTKHRSKDGSNISNTALVKGNLVAVDLRKSQTGPELLEHGHHAGERAQLQIIKTTNSTNFVVNLSAGLYTLTVASTGSVATPDGDQHDPMISCQTRQSARCT
jgi:hypothetical protein